MKSHRVTTLGTANMQFCSLSYTVMLNSRIVETESGSKNEMMKLYRIMFKHKKIYSFILPPPPISIRMMFDTRPDFVDSPFLPPTKRKNNNNMWPSEWPMEKGQWNYPFLRVGRRSWDKFKRKWDYFQILKGMWVGDYHHYPWSKCKSISLDLFKPVWGVCLGKGEANFRVLSAGWNKIMAKTDNKL